ncbi:MAG: hypothetical protein Q7S27_03055 [Nanoarchaeota archaeon]|nr:hypothetical protein [Nanoarchaeota archaeon]
MKKSFIFLLGIVFLAIIVISTWKIREKNEDDGGDFEEKIWNQRIDAALSLNECTSIKWKRYGELYYDGPLIDSHYHIPNLPDYPPGEPEPANTEMRPFLGSNIEISDIVCTLKQENTMKVFAFFPVFPNEDWQYIEVAKRTMDLYPDLFVPFIMPPDNDNSINGHPTVEAKVLDKMLNKYPNLFEGYGEIGLYARQGGAEALAPDSERLLDIYPVIKENNLIVYFHLGEAHQESFEGILEQNPDINFIWHGDQLISKNSGKQNLQHIEEIISRHSNVYYTIDELYGDEWMLRPEVTKGQFLAHLENYEVLLERDLADWKHIIEKYPNQFLWGTDRSPQVLWSHDVEVGQALTNYGRAFIARLDINVQENFAYKNAERLLK